MRNKLLNFKHIFWVRLLFIVLMLIMNKAYGQSGKTMEFVDFRIDSISTHKWVIYKDEEYEIIHTVFNPDTNFHQLIVYSIPKKMEVAYLDKDSILAVKDSISAIKILILGLYHVWREYNYNYETMWKRVDELEQKLIATRRQLHKGK